MHQSQFCDTVLFDIILVWIKLDMQYLDAEEIRTSIILISLINNTLYMLILSYLSFKQLYHSICTVSQWFKKKKIGSWKTIKITRKDSLDEENMANTMLFYGFL